MLESRPDEFMTTPSNQPSSRLRRLAFVVAANALILLAIEGLASTITVVRLEIQRLRPVGERAHTRYDPELGWVNLPNVRSPGMYGPGRTFWTNAQGFRNDVAFPPAVPPGRVRVVCSGDSFTLGYGVSNDEAWCNHLAAIDGRLEPVNMGQGGYGIDQAYLWYRRDAVALAHDLQLFAFITVDFGRMRDSAFLNYPKPMLALDGGRLVTRNVPVPQVPGWRRKLRETIRTIATFRSVQLLQSWLARPAPQTAATAATSSADPLRPIVAEVFRSLRDMHRERGSLLVLVYLPMKSDYLDNPETSLWRAFVREEAARDSILFLDLVDDLRTIPSGDLDSCFIQPNDAIFSRGQGHYTAKGNDFIARALYRRLVSNEAVAARLARASAQSVSDRAGAQGR